MARRPRMKFPQPLNDLLSAELKGSVWAERLREAEIWRLWPEVVGPAVASHSQPVRIINGSLTVAVSSGPWMQELSFLKGMMKEKLNQRLGGEVVREIVLKSGKIDKPATLIDDALPPPKRLSLQQLAQIEEDSSRIADPETRAAFAALMKANMQRSHSK